jgi:sugar O-acyltransferase (sialic acid O-acetyltransferase NeuD family)
MNLLNGKILAIKMDKIIVIGSGGHARVVIDAAIDAGKKVLGLVDTDYQNQVETVLGIKVLGGFEILSKYDKTKVFLIIAIGDNLKRKECYLKLKKQGFMFAKIIHPTAVISKFTTIGEGAFINAGVIINAEVVISNNCIVNSGAIVEHEAKIGDYSHLAPGVRVGGRTLIEEGVFVGIGSNIAHSIKIGRHVTIGAGSVIVKDIPENSTVVGIGRVVK